MNDAARSEIAPYLKFKLWHYPGRGAVDNLHAHHHDDLSLIARIKRKWLILVLGLPVLLLAPWLWMAGGRQIPVDVIGDFSEKDVAELVVAAKHQMRKDILPDSSWQSLKAMPAAIKRYATIKLFTILSHGQAGATICVWQNTNGVTRFSSQTNYLVNPNNDSPPLPGAMQHNFSLAEKNSVTFYFARGTNGWAYITYWH